MSTPLLEIDDVSKVFVAPRRLGQRRPRPVHALRNVTLTLGAREVLGVVGESGSGKSTLARTIVGLVKPTSGEVRLDGRPVDRMDRRERSRIVQLVFQDPYSSLDPTKTVRSLIEEPLKLHTDQTRTERLATVHDLMASVALPDRMMHVRPRQLSGGQRQRVAIARALALEPKVLIADEAVSALDVSTQAQVINLLIKIAETRDISYLFVSHDLRVVRHIADRVAVMSSGRVVEAADTESIYTDPREEYTRKLLAAVPTLAPPPPTARPAEVHDGAPEFSAGGAQ
ncbi:ATP-binding cassette domain-containing protein [Actinophytocola sp.]|uniref:ATP-binding cassette domain-containing protein n=1 Tax=Actinophytocola sp. TaxID=1872138 RepID=UPI003D6A8BBB